MKKTNELLLNIGFILLGIILTGLFWRYNILLTFIYIIAILIYFKIKYEKGEILFLLVAFALGFIVEAVGTFFVGYQSFTNPSFLGIPLWLPIVWGFGFVVFRRIGNIICKK